MSKKSQKSKPTNEARRRLTEIKRRVLDPTTGLTSRKSFYGQTLEEAEAKYQEFVNPVRQTIEPVLDAEALLRIAPKNSFVAVFAREYLPLKTKLEPSGLIDIQYNARHLLPTQIPGLGQFGFIDVRHITSGVIAQALDDLDKRKVLRNPTAKDRDKNPEKWATLAPRTVNKCRLLAIEVMELAHEIDTKGTPFINRKRIPTRDEARKAVPVYTAGQMRLLLEAAKDHSCFVPLLLMLFAGLRIREACGVVKGAVRLTGVLVVEAQQDKFDRQALKDKLKTESSYREILLPAAVHELLVPFTFGEPEERLSLNDKGLPHDPNRLQDAIDRAARRAGLHRLNHHALRHTFSSWLSSNGCPDSTRMAIMGHSSKDVKHRYNHATLKEIEFWLTKLWETAEADAKDLALIELPKGGTKTPSRGSTNGRSKLSEREVLAIKAMLSTGEKSLKKIGELFGVSRHTIAQIRDGLIWKEVV